MVDGLGFKNLLKRLLFFFSVTIFIYTSFRVGRFLSIFIQIFFKFELLSMPVGWRFGRCLPLNFFFCFPYNQRALCQLYNAIMCVWNGLADEKVVGEIFARKMCIYHSWENTHTHAHKCTHSSQSTHSIGK